MAYSKAQIILHWLVAALIAVQYATSGSIARTHEVHVSGLAPDPTDLFLHTIHNRCGMLIGLLMLARFGLRVKHGAPKPLPGLPGWQENLSATVHWAFYGVVLLQVATGFVASYIWWPASAVHGPLFYLLMMLVALHVFAAFWHHRVLRDGTLRRMLP